MRSIYISSIVFAYLGMAVAALQQFITVPLVVALYGEAGYGIFATFFALAGSIAALLNWLSTASAPMLSGALHANDLAQVKKLYQTLKWIHIVCALILIPGGLLLYFATPFLRFESLLPVDSIYLVALFYAATLVATSVEPMLLFAAARADLLNRYRCISQTFTLLAFLIVLYTYPDLRLLFFVAACGTFLLYRLCLQGLRSTSYTALYQVEARFHREYKSLLLKFSSLAGTTSTLRTLIMIDPILLAILLSPEAVTEFSYYWLPANFIILSMWKFSENAQPLFMKSFSERQISRSSSLYKKLLILITAISIGAACLYVLLIGLFQSIWVNFHNSSLLIACVFGLYIICASIYRLDFAVLYANMRFKQLLYLSLIECIAKIILTITLLPYCTFASSIMAQTLIHLLFLQCYAKFLVRKEFSPGTCS